MSFYLNGRRIVYTNQVPYESDILATNNYNMTGVSGLSETILGFGIGNTTTVRGLACSPIAPPGLSVVVGNGVMYSFEFYDETNYGVIPADTNPRHKLYKQAFNFDNVELVTAAPITAGNSVIFLIEAVFQTVDVNDVSRPYFNSADPTLPIFEDNFDTRTDRIFFRAKQGNESPSPVPPTPDAGYIGLYYVLVTHGQTAIVPENITKVSTVEGQPFITEGLTQKVSQATIDGTFVSIPAEQAATYVTGIDVGAVNALICNPTHAYAAPVLGMRITVLVGHTNTGNAALTVSGWPTNNIKKMTPYGLVDLTAGDMIAGGFSDFKFNGLDWVLLNPVIDSTNEFVTIPAEQAATHVTGIDIGTVNVLVCNPSDPYAPPVLGTRITVLVANSNTSSATLQLNGGAVHTIKVADASGLQNLTGGEMVVGGFADLKFDGNNWELLNPALVGKYVTIANEQNATFVTGIDVGTVNAISCNPSNAYGAPILGMRISAIVANTNTGSTTLSINGNTPINIVKMDQLSGILTLDAGDLKAGGIYDFKYNGSNWVLLNFNYQNINNNPTLLIYRNSDINIAPNSPRPVPFDTIGNDLNAIFDLPSLTCTTNRSGIWVISASISLRQTGVLTGGTCFLYVVINGTKFTLGTIYLPGGPYNPVDTCFTISGSLTVPIPAGQTIQFWIDSPSQEVILTGPTVRHGIQSHAQISYLTGY